MKFFRIVYEVAGGKKTDEVFIWANNETDAIKEFTNTEIVTYYAKVKYTKYAIISIQG